MSPGAPLAKSETCNYRLTTSCSLPTSQHFWLTASFFSPENIQTFLFLLFSTPRRRLNITQKGRQVKNEGKERTEAARSQFRLDFWQSARILHDAPSLLAISQIFWLHQAWCCPWSPSSSVTLAACCRHRGCIPRLSTRTRICSWQRAPLAAATESSSASPAPSLALQGFSWLWRVRMMWD